MITKDRRIPQFLFLFIIMVSLLTICVTQVAAIGSASNLNDAENLVSVSIDKTQEFVNETEKLLFLSFHHEDVEGDYHPQPIK